jgi:hypothetical protein
VQNYLYEDLGKSKNAEIESLKWKLDHEAASIRERVVTPKSSPASARRIPGAW